MSKKYSHKIKVYYEDTDSGGVVYYANYLKFLERARSEMLNSVKLSNLKLLKENNVLIVVKSCNINFKKPARLEDELEIISFVKSTTKTSFIMHQSIIKEKETISEAEVHLVVVNDKGKPTKFPDTLKSII
tara:strand:+ start:209 stop:601 length:393 start_codon:yes stop_codon:yes gene_type:complete